jgi:hypothetical protein
VHWCDEADFQAVSSQDGPAAGSSGVRSKSKSRSGRVADPPAELQQVPPANAARTRTHTHRAGVAPAPMTRAAPPLSIAAVALAAVARPPVDDSAGEASTGDGDDGGNNAKRRGGRGCVQLTCLH